MKVSKVKDMQNSVAVYCGLKPKSITAQVAEYADDITALRLMGYYWSQLVDLIKTSNQPLGSRLNEKTLRTYYTNAIKRERRGSLVVKQKKLFVNVKE